MCKVSNGNGVRKKTNSQLIYAFARSELARNLRQKSDRLYSRVKSMYEYILNRVQVPLDRFIGQGIEKESVNYLLNAGFVKVITTKFRPEFFGDLFPCEKGENIEHIVPIR